MTFIFCVVFLHIHPVAPFVVIPYPLFCLTSPLPFFLFDFSFSPTYSDPIILPHFSPFRPYCISVFLHLLCFPMVKKLIFLAFYPVVFPFSLVPPLYFFHSPALIPCSFSLYIPYPSFSFSFLFFSRYTSVYCYFWTLYHAILVFFRFSLLYLVSSPLLVLVSFIYFVVLVLSPIFSPFSPF